MSDKWYLSGPLSIGSPDPKANLTIQTPEPDRGNALRVEGKKEPDKYYLNLSTVVTDSVIRWVFDQTNAGKNFPNVLAFDRGNIGIGTSDPKAKLHIAGGDVGPTNFGDIKLSSTDPIADCAYTGGNDGVFWFVHHGKDDGATHFRNRDRDLLIIRNNGNVGIGTQPTFGTLQVNGNIVSGRPSDGTNAGFIDWRNLTNNKIWHLTMRSGDGDKLQLYHHNATNWVGPVLSVDPDGNVGIGTNTPKANLHVSNGAILNWVAIGVDPPPIPGAGDLAFPFPYETIGTIHPGHNLRLHSNNSIAFHTGNAKEPSATIDNAGNLGVKGSLHAASELRVGYAIFGNQQDDGTVRLNANKGGNNIWFKWTGAFEIWVDDQCIRKIHWNNKDV